MAGKGGTDQYMKKYYISKHLFSGTVFSCSREGRRDRSFNKIMRALRHLFH